MPSPTAAAPVLTAKEAVTALQEARERTLALIAPLSSAELEHVHSPLMSPLVWDLGHIAAFEDLWLAHRFAGEPLLAPELADVYDAFETPRCQRAERRHLAPAEALDYLRAVRVRILEGVERRGVEDGLLHELVLRHEHQHNETMLQTLQLSHLSYEPELRAEPPAAPPGWPDMSLELIDVPAGDFELGAPAHGFAYDNERPRHVVHVPAFSIGRTPITNATFLHFVEGGGYRRREWWSDEGWAWKEEYDITHPGEWTADGAEWRMGRLAPLHPDRPVVHVSWFEADAFARAHGARLPTETEWEKASTWDQETGAVLTLPWGEAPPDATRANLDQLRFGTAAAGAYPAGASPCGCVGMLGDVWEWTASEFRGYPGFAAHPYREYSELFFGPDHRVLRGGSWATRARAVRPTFRNWDFPQRRQIFAGFRLARTLADLDPDSA